MLVGFQGQEFTLFNKFCYTWLEHCEIVRKVFFFFLGNTRQQYQVQHTQKTQPQVRIQITAFEEERVFGFQGAQKLPDCWRRYRHI